MNTNQILQGLRAERDRLERAITAIEAIDGTRAAQPRVGKRARPALSAAARKRISLARKKWWAERKRAAKPRRLARKITPRPFTQKKVTPKSTARKTTTATATRKSGSKPHISSAGRKRLSEMMKKRWAEKKRSAAAAAKE